MAGIRQEGDSNRYLRDLSRRIEAGKSLKVGFLEGAKYPDGTPVAYVAALNNYGHGATPPRPFFSNLIATDAKDWGETFGSIMRQVDNDTEKALRILGEHIRGALRQSIVDTYAPPLSLLTLMIRKWQMKNPGQEVTGTLVGELAASLAGMTRRGEAPNLEGVSTKPLVVTGQMIRSADYEVQT